MGGGIDRIRIDNVADYGVLRRAVFDIDLAPLPDNLPLSAHDEALNRQANWRAKPPETNPASTDHNALSNRL